MEKDEPVNTNDDGCGQQTQTWARTGMDREDKACCAITRIRQRSTGRYLWQAVPLIISCTDPSWPVMYLDVGVLGPSGGLGVCANREYPRDALASLLGTVLPCRFILLHQQRMQPSATRVHLDATGMIMPVHGL